MLLLQPVRYDLGSTKSYAKRFAMVVLLNPDGGPLVYVQLGIQKSNKVNGVVQTEVYYLDHDPDLRPGVLQSFVMARTTGEFAPDRPGLYRVERRSQNGPWRCTCLGERGHRTEGECRHGTMVTLLEEDGLIEPLMPARHTTAA